MNSMRILLGGIGLEDAEIRGVIPQDAAVIYASDFEELIENVYVCSPDVLVVSREMPDVWPALQQISVLLPAPVVMVAQSSSAADSAMIGSTDIFAYLVRPVDAGNLQQAIHVACAQFRRLYGARSEALQLREAFASRKVIDRAKGVIMQRQRISEGEAYTFLREESRRQRIPIAEIAKTFLNETESPSKIFRPATPPPAARRISAR